MSLEIITTNYLTEQERKQIKETGSHCNRDQDSDEPNKCWRKRDSYPDGKFIGADLTGNQSNK